MNNIKEKLLAIFLMFSSLILDGFIASYWATNLNTNFGLMIPRLIFLVFIILSFHYDKNFMITSATIFGFLMDAYYLGFFGIYIVSFIMIVYLTFNLKQLLQSNIISYTMLAFLTIAIVETFIYGVVWILGVTTISFQQFLISKLAATLLLNTSIMLLFSYLIHLLIEHAMDKN